jgi:uncharacterized protein YfiM (DUF2279 family)
VSRALIAAALLSLAACNAKAEAWHGKDKNLHFAGGAVIASAVTLATGRADWGFVASTTVGIAKEVYDMQHRPFHVPSVKDAVVTMVGAAVGAAVTGLVITPTGFLYRKEF